MTEADSAVFPTFLADMTPTGLLITFVGFVIIAIFRGWIIVKIHYDILVQTVNDQRETITTLRETNAVQASTIDKQTAVGETVIRVMTSVQEAREGAESP